MDKKSLAIKLSKLKPLEQFSVKLEQYQLDGNLASDLLWLAYQNGDLKNKVVADFGCGNGILGVGALLLGAKFVYFLDIDHKALKICKENLKSFNNFKIINSDISSFNKKVDVVVMNPPFGVQKRKADKVFLEIAMKFSDMIYSIHKIASKGFIRALARENRFYILRVVENNFILKKTFDFHTKNRYDVSIGIWVLNRQV